MKSSPLGFLVTLQEDHLCQAYNLPAYIQRSIFLVRDGFQPSHDPNTNGRTSQKENVPLRIKDHCHILSKVLTR
jgi:hypothetical protein